MWAGRRVFLSAHKGPPISSFMQRHRGEKSMLRVCAQKQKKTFWKYNFIQHMTEKHLNEAQQRLHTIESCQQVYRRSGRNHFVENKIFASVFFPHTISQQNLTNNSVTNSIPHNTYYYPEL
jgi:hypothetical protein